MMKHVRQLLPELNFLMRKGSCGRIGVIGGSVEYTGAPYFAAISALKLGADLVHVFCPTEAASVIKGYSPELMVHPGFEDEAFLVTNLDRLDALVLGPGLGRDPRRESLVRSVLNFAKQKRLPTVIDADGLWFLRDMLDEFRGADTFFLTPNVIEFHRLMEKAVGESDLKEYTNLNYALEKLRIFSSVSGMSLYLKGSTDLVFPAGSPEPSLCAETGMPRRCGGQGDLTAGTLAVFYLWATRSIDSLSEAQMVAGRASHEFVRFLAQQAFAKHGRSTTASDMIAQIGNVLLDIDNAK